MSAFAVAILRAEREKLRFRLGERCDELEEVQGHACAMWKALDDLCRGGVSASRGLEIMRLRDRLRKRYGEEGE